MLARLAPPPADGARGAPVGDHAAGAWHRPRAAGMDDFGAAVQKQVSCVTGVETTAAGG
jgi:hypothetical protein